MPDFDTDNMDDVELVEKESGKVLARGELFVDEILFAIRITEVL